MKIDSEVYCNLFGSGVTFPVKSLCTTEIFCRLAIDTAEDCARLAMEDTFCGTIFRFESKQEGLIGSSSCSCYSHLCDLTYPGQRLVRVYHYLYIIGTPGEPYNHDFVISHRIFINLD